MNIGLPPPHGVLGSTEGTTDGDPESLVGRTVRGRYRIEAVLERGSRATVFRAAQVDGGAAIAVKIPAPDSTRGAKREFERVSALFSELEHDRLPRIVDRGGTEDGQPLLAMELLRGTSLEDLGKPVAPARAVELIAGVLDGLRYLHGREIVHGGLSAKKVLVCTSADGDDAVKIVDLGAALVGSERPQTMGGMLTGKPGYVAPEQALGAAFDQRVDLYASGVLLYELLTGGPAWPAGDAEAVLEYQLEHSIPRLPAHLSMLDPLVQRLAAREQSDRFPSAATALEAVAACIDAVPRDGAPDDSAIFGFDEPSDRMVEVVAAAAAASVGLEADSEPDEGWSPKEPAKRRPPPARSWRSIVLLAALGAAASASVTVATCGGQTPLHEDEPEIEEAALERRDSAPPAVPERPPQPSSSSVADGRAVAVESAEHPERAAIPRTVEPPSSRAAEPPAEPASTRKRRSRPATRKRDPATSTSSAGPAREPDRIKKPPVKPAAKHPASKRRIPVDAPEPNPYLRG